MSLGDAVRSRLLTVPGRVGFYARNLRTSERVSFDGDAVLPTESGAKTFILLHYSALVAASDIDPGTRVALDSDTDAVIGSGVLRYLDRGLELTLEDLARLMIIVSDNVATHILLRTVGGPSAVNAAIDALGARDSTTGPCFRLPQHRGWRTVRHIERT